jgi:hypothetical protein
MPKPDQKPANAGFIRFNPLVFKKNVQLFHKFPFGHVDLQLAGYGNRLAAIKSRYGKYLEAGMTIEKAAKSGVVRINVERMDVESRLPKNHAMEGIKAALRLLRIYERVLKNQKAT